VICNRFHERLANNDKITTFTHTKTKNTDGFKFTDPSMAAVSPYFKRSMLNMKTVGNFRIYIFKLMKQA